jgi:Rhodanese-related sulfurtransferase
MYLFSKLNYISKFKNTMNEQQQYYARKLQFEIDSWDLSVALSQGEKLQVIDARSVDAFDKEHIPGGISLPHRTMCEATTSDFDRDTLYVVYCDGIGCNASTKGALNMATLGFQVKELIGGIDWWKRDGHPTESTGSVENVGKTCGC